MSKVDSRKYSEQELAEFERTMGIQLLDVYKRYIREVGAGVFSASKVSLLEDWCQPISPERLPPDFLRQPFSFHASWNDLTLKDPMAGWGAPYYDAMLFRGSMRIVNLGCEGYNLLVVSGDERGNVWCDERASFSKGIHPLEGDGGKRVTIEEYLSNWPNQQA